MVRKRSLRANRRSNKRTKRVNRACLFGGAPSPDDDVKYWNVFEYDAEHRIGRRPDGKTIIAYVSNTTLDGYPTKYCIVRLDEKMVNIESSGDFEVWGHFPNNFVPFRKLEDNGDTGVEPERIYILTAEQVEGIYAIILEKQSQKSRQTKPPQLEIPLLSYLNKNNVLYFDRLPSKDRRFASKDTALPYTAPPYRLPSKDTAPPYRLPSKDTAPPYRLPSKDTAPPYLPK